METRRLIFAMFAALAVYMLYMSIYKRMRPPPPPPQTTEDPFAPPEATTAPSGAAPGSQPAPAAASAPSAQSAPAAGALSGFAFTAGPQIDAVTLGDDTSDPLVVALHPQGASVARMELTARRDDGRFVHRATTEENTPYVLLEPLTTPVGTYRSFTTQQLWLYIDQTTYNWPMGDLLWQVVEQERSQVTFEVVLRSDEADQALVRLLKTYALVDGKPLILLKLSAENLSDKPYALTFEQDGPLGIRKEHIQYNMRFLTAGLRGAEGQIELSKAYEGSALQKPGEHNLRPSDETRFVWTGLSNKYFAVVTRPLKPDKDTEIIQTVRGTVAAHEIKDSRRGDLLAKLRTVPRQIEPGGSVEFDFEIYAGIKSTTYLRAVNPAYVDPLDLGYVALRSTDKRCCCTFGWLTQWMIGLLEAIHVVVRNYGIAIIILVLIVRTLLHPLTVFQQKSMYNTQEGMSRIQPKMAAIKEKHANDRVRMNQEMMKLYSEENVNPAAAMVSMVPMLLQMPILIALWTGLNTDINLRHAPLDGIWINDLSAPDQLIPFGGNGLTIPLLGQLVPFMFANIPALNLLPMLMGVSMWLQQKYMPKPHLEEKLRQAKKAREEGRKAETGPGGTSVEDQIRQQQMIAYMMSIMFPLMFYYMPSGLNLYWMSTNVIGIFESLRVRKQIEREKERRKLEGPKPAKAKKKGAMAKFFEKMASQAEGLQKKADTLSSSQPASPRRADRKKGKKKH